MLMSEGAGLAPARMHDMPQAGRRCRCALCALAEDAWLPVRACFQNDALRKFYFTLYEQRPESEMAKKWCVHRPTAAPLPPSPAPVGTVATYFWGSGCSWQRNGLACLTPVCRRPAPGRLCCCCARLHCRCLTYGLLPRDEAEELVALLKKSKPQAKWVCRMWQAGGGRVRVTYHHSCLLGGPGETAVEGPWAG
jgi:hypothetical protein